MPGINVTSQHRILATGRTLPHRIFLLGQTWRMAGPNRPDLCCRLRAAARISYV